ncbi:MAG: MBL fold metallo-hydrolase [Deltaproteobacteria bacterium]|nr:MBL fold metallo-hydrolase [Deltaproteobacteria bacterium]
MRLVGDLFSYVWSGKDNNCNSYVLAGVLTGDRHVLIDPGHVTTPALREPGLQSLFERMEEDGLDPTAIGLVLLTHFHPDHSEAANVIREKTRALVALHEAEVDLYSSFGGKVDLLLGEGDLDLGTEAPVQLTVFHSPGHSPGHTTFYWAQERVLIAGDLIFYRSTGRVDIPGGDARALKSSINRLSELDIEYVLCGHPYGHSGVIEGADEVRQNFEFLRTNILF